MKTRILIIIGLVFSSFQMMGFENTERIESRRIFEEPIYFVENNIEFYVFSNGDFDFNALPETECYYKNGVRYEVVQDNRPVRIRKDYYGRITSVGNVSIKYLRDGKVSRIGQIRIKYQNHHICQVGHLTITINPHGYYHYRGYVNKPHRHYHKKRSNYYSYNKKKKHSSNYYYKENSKNRRESSRRSSY
ncbi:hypothetical protein [Aureivirga sp. CE67]|uniref:hypothetical protein n=1 Tax=Aureivirga sp. CE67 TaxID=1788983 RepID=UPI0018CB7D0E|nr:hypothetical protein [Aureivirga sp. CE67]